MPSGDVNAAGLHEPAFAESRIETRWIVWTLPGGAVSEWIGNGALLMTLSAPTTEPGAIREIERAAKEAGMVLTRDIGEQS